MTDTVLPGPNATADTVRTILTVLDDVAATLAKIDVQHTHAVIHRDSVDLTPRELRLLRAADAFRVQLETQEFHPDHTEQTDPAPPTARTRNARKGTPAKRGAKLATG